jgi:hypothetical protein
MTQEWRAAEELCGESVTAGLPARQAQEPEEKLRREALSLDGMRFER